MRVADVFRRFSAIGGLLSLFQLAFSASPHSFGSSAFRPRSVTQTDDGEELFCFISEDERLDRTSCHIFQMPPGKARETCLIIGAAFQIAGAEAEEDNPFKPISERDTLQFPGCLSEKMINRALLKAVKVVGSGQFGKVYLATMKHSLAEGAQVDNCAVKLLRGGANTSTKAEFLREAAIMAELAHPNLCSMLGVSIQHRPWLVVLEFIQYGDLREIFHVRIYPAGCFCSIPVPLPSACLGHS